MTEPKNPGCRRCEYYLFAIKPAHWPSDEWVYYRCLHTEHKKTKFDPVFGEQRLSADCEKLNLGGKCEHFKQAELKPEEMAVGIKCYVPWWKRLFGCGG